MTVKRLPSRLCATLAAMLAVTSLAGCDAPQTPDGEFGDDTDGETDGVEPDDGDGPLGSTGGSDDAPPDDPTNPDDDQPFDDDPSAALGALGGMGYVCYDAEDTSYNLYFDEERVTARFADDSTSEGTYDTAGGMLNLSFPELSFAEAAVDAVVALDAVVYFETTSLRCGAYLLDHAAPDGTDIFDCPSIKYIPETSWEKNQFHFGAGGYVLRRRWTELPAVPDTLYAERLGVYRLVGEQVYIVLPFEDEGEQWLTGTLTDEGLYIDQLEPERGACE